MPEEDDSRDCKHFQKSTSAKQSLGTVQKIVTMYICLLVVTVAIPCHCIHASIQALYDDDCMKCYDL